MIGNLSLAVDIDDTICKTAHCTFQLAHQVFGHEKSALELEVAYGQPGEVPEWKTSEVEAWLDAHLGSAEYLYSLPPIDNAASVLSELQKQYVVTCYITSRFHFMKEKTVKWLNAHHFPTAPVITRDTNARAKQWKLHSLTQRSSRAPLLIDDAVGELTFSELQSYPEKLIWFNPFEKKSATPPNVISVSNWHELKKLLE